MKRTPQIFLTGCIAKSPRIEELYKKDPICLKFAILFCNKLCIEDNLTRYVYLDEDCYGNMIYEWSLIEPISKSIYYSIDSNGNVMKYS